MAPRSRSPRKLYEPMTSFSIRAPLLPVERYLSLPDKADPAQDPLVRAALCVASPTLLAELERGTRDRRGAAALLRYLIRMSTRPTPYGLFAGLGIASWAPGTDLRLAAGARSVQVRPDMGWLIAMVLGVERAAGAHAEVRLLRNSTAFEREGRLHLSDRATAGQAGRPDVSIRVTPVVRRALERARTPVAYAELVSDVLAQTPGATREQVVGLVDTLRAQDLLLSDLRPPFTGDPVAHVLARLPAPAADHLAAVMEAAAQAEAALRGADSGATEALTAPCDVASGGVGALGVLRTRMRAVPGVDVADGEDLVQVDCALPLAGRTLAGGVAADAVRAVDLLMRMHPDPGGSRRLAGYRAAFVARYGTGRRVPLLELLDPRFGLGPPGTGHARAAGGNRQAPARRSAKLLDLATTALRDGSREVVLGEDEVEELSTWRPLAAQLPRSLELSAFLMAASAQAVDRGDYTLAVGPNLGAQAAGRGLGRFADVVGQDAANLLKEIASAEAAGMGGGTVSAELVYLPARHRSANVTVRPSLRGYEIPVGVSASVPPERVIALDELAVSVGEGRLRLWWTAGGVEVSVFAGHMLNPAGAPAVCRFLHEIGTDGVTPLAGFDWGPATTLPAVPRVRVGRVVLRPAQWRQPRARLARTLRIGDRAAFDAALREWRERWRVPSQVYLSAGDNRLLLDLDDTAQADQLRDELRGDRAGDLLLQEALPGPGDAWLTGPGGCYLSELIVPMIRREHPPVAAAPMPVPAAVDEVRDRLRPPGSDWLYLTLYSARHSQDQLIHRTMHDLAEALVASGHADQWFFLRYADPEPHLRLRLHGEPGVLLADALPRAMAWAAGLVAEGRLTRVGLQVYEREVERYGGPAAIGLAEAVFAADSRAVAELLALLERPGQGGPDRVELAVLGVDDLLASLGLDRAARLAWYGDAAPPPKESGSAYRRRSARLRDLLGGGDGEAWRGAVADILARRHAALAPVGQRLASLHDAGRLSLPVAAIARSLAHMHCNRLGLDPATERILLGLLRRTRASLAAAPLRAAAPGR